MTGLIDSTRLGLEVVVEDGEAVDAFVPSLLRNEPDIPYANFRPLRRRRENLIAMLRQRWDDRSDRIAVVTARDTVGRAIAALRLGHRKFESEHFGLPMARIDLPLAPREESVRLAALRLMYPAAYSLLSSLGYRHVALRASTRDAVASWAVQEGGAAHVNTQVSWMCSTTEPVEKAPLPEGLYYEFHDRESVRQIDAKAWTRLDEWSGHAFDQGPFSRDLTLPRERSLSLYRAWTTHVMTGKWADVIFVVRNRDEVVAFIALLQLADLSEAAGVGVLGRGLGATLPEHSGLFTAIQKELIRRRPGDASFIENETQTSTVGSVNVYAKLGFRYLRSTETYHRRLDGVALQ